MNNPLRPVVDGARGLPALLLHRLRQELAARRARRADKNNYPMW